LSFIHDRFSVLKDWLFLVSRQRTSNAVITQKPVVTQNDLRENLLISSKMKHDRIVKSVDHVTVDTVYRKPLTQKQFSLVTKNLGRNVKCRRWLIHFTLDANSYRPCHLYYHCNYKSDVCEFLICCNKKTLVKFSGVRSWVIRNFSFKILGHFQKSDAATSTTATSTNATLRTPSVRSFCLNCILDSLNFPTQ
jgi:hypothetical protein